ncbi:transcriptional regulator [Streptomyces sp. NEAU-sy36]|uniref:AfsR/SARP family transcriptional regulator n=1 Tax=unclassified Streptomyces TaxID=2593676 RepID=UPI0015D5DC36|nr:MULTISPECIES: transcriptional regulator [unclassified Streptomyces]QLJ04419.1 transcriptional regulator [Streptomyces sp. NEAU-sy36]
MEFRVLGPIEARAGDTRVPLSGSKVYTVLAALLLARGRVVSDQRLTSLLWGWDPPATAGAQIYTYMSRLRKRLGDEIEIVRRPPGYVLATRDSWIDLLEFERLEQEGRAALGEGRYREAAALLDRALALWQGPALSNATHHLRETELPQLEEARTLALEGRIEADLALGRHEEVLAELTGLVAGFPVREQLRAQLMTALYRCGRQADALHVYHDARKVLADQLGVDPGAALDATYQAVLNGSIGLESPPLIALRDRFQAPSAPAMLPPDVEDFTGRSAELPVLRAVLEPHDTPGWQPRRCLVTGMAGVGKTALVVHAAHLSAGHHPDGQLYVELREPDGTPRDPCAALVRLLRALGEPRIDAPGVHDDLEELTRLYRSRTAGRRLLVVLDDAVGDLQVRPLLPSTSTASVLITCRTHLTQVPGAQTVRLGPLDAEESRVLLASAAGRERLSAEPDASAALLAHCAGLPLALRITGTRLAARPHWSPARLAPRLADPRTRLDELRFGDLSVRQALGRSLPSLSRAGRAALRGLAGFPDGSCTAQQMAFALETGESEAERGLEELVDGSLLTINGLDQQGRPIYGCHTLVRLFAYELSRPSLLPAQRRQDTGILRH